MSKLQVKMVEPVFVLQRRVIYGDTDAGGVVYYANYLRYFEIGRSEMMRNLAVPYSEIEKRGFILPVTESYIRYKAPARYDDLITISTSLVEIKKVSCRFHYRVTLRTKEQEQLLVNGFTVHACVDRRGKLTPFPADILEQMKKIKEKEQADSSLS